MNWCYSNFWYWIIFLIIGIICIIYDNCTFEVSGWWGPYHGWFYDLGRFLIFISFLGLFLCILKLITSF
jgi:hypothetical protein